MATKTKTKTKTTRSDAAKRSNIERVKALYQKRRDDGVCIYDSPRSAYHHGPPYRGGRCRGCWKRKLEAEVASYAKRRLSNMGDG